MKMTLSLVYFTSLSILQIFYVTGDSVSWSSPSTTYSSISSQSVPTYNGNLQQESMSSTIQPFKISGGILTNQIDNMNTKISSNIGLDQDSNKIFVKQVVDQQGDNNDASVSENIITNIRPFEMSFGSSLSSTTIPNFEIPVHNNGPGLSNIYHETSKMSDMSRLNEVNELDGSSGSDGGFQSGEFDGLSESISEDGLNLVDSLGKFNELNENGLRREYIDEIGGSKTYLVGKQDNYRRGHKSKKNNLISENGASTELSLGAGKGSKQGFNGEGGTMEFGELGRNGGGRMFIQNGENKEEGRDKRLSGSVESIQFGRKNGGRVDGSARKEGGVRGFSRSNGSIRFGGRNKSGTGGLGGKERRDRGFNKQNGFIRFSRKRKNGEGGSSGEEGGDRGFSQSNASIRSSRKNGVRKGESDVEEGGDRGFSRYNGPIQYSRKYKSGLGREEGGDVGIGRSNGSIRFSRKNKGREGGSGGKEEESRGFSGSVGSLSLDRNKKSGTGGFGGENIKINEGQRAQGTSKSRGVGRMNGNGGKRTFGGSVGGITFGEESGDKGPSKSNSININRTVGNYGGGRFDGYIEGNGFSREYSTGKESDGGAFGEFGPEMVEKLKWVN